LSDAVFIAKSANGPIGDVRLTPTSRYILDSSVVMNRRTAWINQLARMNQLAPRKPH
jgi:hypothetical protein